MNKIPSFFFALLVFPVLGGAVSFGAPTNNANDQYLLGSAYLKGTGVTQSYEQAGFWYRKAADQGNLKAMHNLALLYLEGKGTPKNEQEGYRLIRKAAELGDPKSVALLGILLCNGTGIAADPVAGKEWLEKGVQAGNPEAMLTLGKLDLKEMDPSVKQSGHELILRAADLGNTSACLQAGRMISLGYDGVPGDKKRAEVYYRRGAEAGDPWCRFEYAKILMIKSPLQAYPWAKLAVRDHVTAAIGIQQECIGFLKPEELLEGDRRADEIDASVPSHSTPTPTLSPIPTTPGSK
jgi:TPR repeat protein